MTLAAGPADIISTRSARRDGFLEVVGDEQHRLAVGGPQIEQQVAHDLARLRIERPERLIHQQDLGIADQHLREPDALPLPAGELVGVAIAEGCKTHVFQPQLCPLQGLAPRRCRQPSRPMATLSRAVFQGISASCCNR